MFFKDILSNHILNIAVLSWFFAQIFKGLISLIETHEFSWERFTGSGGMPSSHSAMVTSVVMSSYYICGFSSPVFAIACCFSFIVIYDATNVRYQVGKQGELLNRFREFSEDAANLVEKEFKEHVGHSKLEVLAGIFLGIAVALFYRILFLRA